MGSWFDYTINGLIVGNIYALLAVGLALIFGVSHLINFAHGSVYSVGAFLGWVAVTYAHTPLAATLAIVAVGCALLGAAIERLALRPLQNAPRIAPLLATIGVSIVIDQCVQLGFGADPRALPNPLPDWRLSIGGGSIGALDLLIAGVGIGTAAVLFGFLRFTRLGWAVRATAQDRDAARQMGVDVDVVNSTVFAIAGALGGVAGVLVGMYYNSIDPSMSYQATLKGVVAQVIGGVGNVPGAIAGSLLLGVIESWGVGLLGSSYRNLFAYVLLIVVLVWRPNGLFSHAASRAPEPLTGTFIAPSRPVVIRARWWGAAFIVAALLPLAPGAIVGDYLLRTLTNAWLYGLLALSLTVVAGTAGQVSLGQAALLTIGAYASSLLALDAGWPVIAAILVASVVTGVIGALLVWPAFRLRGHYVSIATLGIGEIVALVVLNGGSFTRGPIGVAGIPPLSFGGYEVLDVRGQYWISLTVLGVLSLALWRLLGSHLGRTWRAMRDDDVAARAQGIALDRYKGLAFGVAGAVAGMGGAIMAHVFSYINHETFTSQVSVLAITMVILGGLGNLAGAVLGALVLIGLPEWFRALADYRMLIYGLALLLLIRFRPQGLLGTR
ncbi:ABC transporter permease [Pandoraea captiosa]|uniref:ABC transporter permease n=1 Tax=Pandoraea captiosa TaxID=2508302 RepID=A0A5E5A8K7_9BURK|nr:ABC transporter permease [Pandoraea captiosa]VVE69939.1 ABC transporter permease [Pandoraea captiosa]